MVLSQPLSRDDEAVPWSHKSVFPENFPVHDVVHSFIKSFSMATMKFYFDVISPFAYIAWPLVRKLGPVDPVPVLFAGLLNHHKSVGPAEVEAKRLYVAKQCARLAKEHGLPFGVPPTHPFNPLAALRLAAVRASVLEMTHRWGLL